MATANTTARSSVLTPILESRRAPVGLQVFSDDLVLSGHFHRWDAAVASGPDLDVLTVRMAVDASSPDPIEAAAAEGDTVPELFSFHSTNVSALAPNTFRAVGELTTASGVRPFETLIEVPGGHSAFFVMSFIARAETLGFGWKELVSDVMPLGGMDAERRVDPRTGVRNPILGAA